MTPVGEEEGVDEGVQQRQRKSGTTVSVFVSCLLDEDHELSQFARKLVSLVGHCDYLLVSHQAQLLKAAGRGNSSSVSFSSLSVHV